jgi:tartrate-resistant acid phosphatase type 5
MMPKTIVSRRAFLFGVSGMVLAVAGAAAGQERELAFLVIGDWGMSSSDQRRLAVQLGDVAERLGARFIVSTGDNFYPDGVASVADPRWRTAFEGVYTAPSLQIPWYVALGNHDYRGDVTAQIAYSGKSPRWRLPAAHFRHAEALPDGGTVELFFLDTDPIKRSYEVWSRRPTAPFAHEELAWLERELAASRARWKIVIGHHPVFSGGSHPDTPVLVTHLKPVLERYGVQAYLNGHSHALEHMVDSGVHYVTSGAGAKPKPARPISPTRFVAGERLGFVAVRLSSDVMEIEFIDEQGAVLHRANIELAPSIVPVGAR